MLETERLLLRLMNLEDTQEIVRWRNDPRILGQFFSCRGITEEQHRLWFDSYIKSENRMEFIIIPKNDCRKIGCINLSQIDHRNQTAEYGIFIGESDALGNGYAKEASRAIIRFGFEELNLRRIVLRVFMNNQSAIALYEKLGFESEGILKQAVFKNGQYQDVMMMALCRN